MAFIPHLSTLLHKGVGVGGGTLTLSPSVLTVVMMFVYSLKLITKKLAERRNFKKLSEKTQVRNVI